MTFTWDEVVNVVGSEWVVAVICLTILALVAYSILIYMDKK